MTASRMIQQKPAIPISCVSSDEICDLYILYYHTKNMHLTIKVPFIVEFSTSNPRLLPHDPLHNHPLNSEM